jgi:hypothetical protein
MEKAVQLDEKFLANFLDLEEAEIRRLPHGTDGRTINDLVAERHKRRMQALATALESEDDLGKVVRGHIHIEHELQQIIFFAAPNPDQLKAFERQEFSEKVRLALVLGLKSDLASPLNAAGNLRNKFAHQLDTTLNQEMAKNLVATLPAALRARFEALLRNVVSEGPKALIAKLPPAWKAQIEAALGHSILELADPFDILKGEARVLAEARVDVLVFYLCLFEELANERHRFAFEKIQRMKAAAA